MNHAALRAFDATRNFENKAVRSLCYAPFTNLFFDQQGNACVCCWNKRVPVGNVLRDSMDEIWRGPKIQQLREALRRDDLSKGCNFCSLQIKDGVFAGSSILQFEKFDVPGSDPDWPQRMEFSISNSCNLECVMCSGDFSSAIRARREKREAMPRIYSDEILESMRAYLPHLKKAKFLGGEPFLVTEYFRLWDMMVEDDCQIECHVTTNGTQYSKRIERLLDRIPMSFNVSIDGATKQTYENIRIGANFDEVLENAGRLREYARERNTWFGFSYCLMRQNWRELGDFCALADAWDVECFINTVHYPAEHGIYSLPPSGLREVLDGMEKQASTLDARLGRNKAVWFAEFDRIRAHVRAYADNGASARINTVIDQSAGFLNANVF